MAAVGCSGDTPLQPAAFPTAFVRAGCARVQACCVQQAQSPVAGDAQTSCEAMYDFSAALMGDLGEAVRQGRAVYDADKAVACVDKLATIGCDIHIDVTRADMVSDECAQAVRGLVSVGGDCQSTWECAPGLFCDGVSDGDHRCVSRRPDGAPCTSDEQCAGSGCLDWNCQLRPPMCTAG
ncbi:MAG TPA: hypothetical protein VH374_17130 [Polyangia bacterium]|nr:hypothetical protein [Polyangia bacterium]